MRERYIARDLPLLLGSHLLLLITFPASRLYAAAAQGRTEMSNMSICT
jgi:hypothetical protein